jgi:serine-type D-Ala-D-Ala carboxypeptidase (penicillin-binding protein 5/6)
MSRVAFIAGRSNLANDCGGDTMGAWLQRWHWTVCAGAALLLALAVMAADRVAAQGGEITVKSPQAIMVDADSGAVMFQRNADDLVSPASMSKLALLAVVFKALKNDEIKLADEFLMSENAWRKGGAPSGTSAMMVPVGTREKVEDLLKGIIVQSGNDAAMAIAENMAGSEDAFAVRMTQEVRGIGLKKSVFKNATGFYHPEHLVTVRELAMLARYIIREYPEYYQLFALKEFPYRKHRFFNRNPLLNVVTGVDGLKTGFIKESGYGLVVSAKQENRRLIVVIDGAQSAEERKDDGRRLLEWGFKNFSEAKLFDAGEVVGHARVWGGDRMFVPLVGNGDVSVVLPRLPANQKLTARIYYKAPLKPPLRKGDAVATLRVTTSTEASSEVPLYVGEDVARAGVMRRGLDSLLYLATRWLP